jgi:hypothetical protein
MGGSRESLWYVNSNIAFPMIDARVSVHLVVRARGEACFVLVSMAPRAPHANRIGSDSGRQTHVR